MVEQMTAPHVPVIGRELMERIEAGFMRNGKGRIFFLRGHGADTIPCPVLADGRILNRGDLNRVPFRGTTVVDLVHPRDLGITELRWIDPEELRQ